VGSWLIGLIDLARNWWMHNVEAGPLGNAVGFILVVGGLVFVLLLFSRVTR